MHTPDVKIIADSISEEGIRIRTYQLRYWRSIHSELMTHRKFGRNAGSSRARPVVTVLQDCMDAPWGPSHWGKNQPGMQADVEQDALVVFPEFMEGPLRAFYDLPNDQECFFALKPKEAWHFTAWMSAISAKAFNDAEYHKQIVNRILEPYTYIDVLVTATDFNNWFALRDHPAAQPEIRELAHAMFLAGQESVPQLLLKGQWHLPYIKASDRDLIIEYLNKDRIIRSIPTEEDILAILLKMSAARCARVSYKLFDGKSPSVENDLKLFEDLLVSRPVHASPSEHQATPDFPIKGTLLMGWENSNLHGNLTGWIQHRKLIPNEYIEG